MYFLGFIDEYKCVPVFIWNIFCYFIKRNFWSIECVFAGYKTLLWVKSGKNRFLIAGYHFLQCSSLSSLHFDYFECNYW